VAGPGATLAVGAALLLLAAAGALREGHPRAPTGRIGPAPRPAASCSPEAIDAAGVRIVGAEPAARVARSALEQLLATEPGARAREILRSGALRGPLTIELNQRGENFTPYRSAGSELGETIVFDPSARSLVETEQGKLPATPATILAHEIGHAVFKLRSEEDVIEAVENPVRRELGLPRRLRY
jgi:hypothetical protein